MQQVQDIFSHNFLQLHVMFLMKMMMLF